MTRKILAIASLTLCLYLAPAAAIAEEAGIKQPSFDSDGVPIHYMVTGPEDGEPVVLIHGFAGYLETWAMVTAKLKKDFKVIALDCRGHGGSGKPHDPKKYGAEMANDVARLLDHLKIDKAHIVGYSMGSGIALSFAIHHPQRVRTLTLGGTGVEREHDDIILAVADALEKGEGLGPLITALTPKDQPKPTPEMLKLIDNMVLATNDAKALAAVARGGASDRPTDQQVSAIAAPVLAIIGSDDPLRPGVDRLKQLLPGTKVVVIDHANHMTAFIRPEFLATLRQFLAENRREPGK